MTSLAIAGSTGSIGTQAIDVVRQVPELFEVFAIGAHSSVEALAKQAAELHPRVVAIADQTRAAELERLLPTGVELRAGDGALASLAIEAEVVLNAVVGFAGLPVTLAALEQGRRLALANKESLVAGGPLVAKVRNTPGAELIPVDSEHGALHQCLRSETEDGRGDLSRVDKLVLTASGGPFRGKTRDQLQDVTVEQALAHPTWKMGPKVTIDSSTLFNKGLEVIEAEELFGVGYDRIEVVVHPQSIIHSAVTFTDGSTIAQLSVPDMRLPIGYAIGQPDRLTAPFGPLDWANLGDLTFEAPDLDTFPCLRLAFEAGRAGGTAPTWLNAANEVAVDGFLRGLVTWSSISSIIERTLESNDPLEPSSVDEVVAADAAARRIAQEALARV